MKLRDIKFMPAVLSLNEFSKYYQYHEVWLILWKNIFKQFIADPYVRVLMLNGKTGKKMKKKKTKFLRAVAQPEFNEILTFDLAITQLDTVQFLVVLCSKVNCGKKRLFQKNKNIRFITSEINNIFVITIINNVFISFV